MRSCEVKTANVEKKERKKKVEAAHMEILFIIILFMFLVDVSCLCPYFCITCVPCVLFVPNNADINAITYNLYSLYIVTCMIRSSVYECMYTAYWLTFANVLGGCSGTPLLPPLPWVGPHITALVDWVSNTSLLTPPLPPSHFGRKTPIYLLTLTTHPTPPLPHPHFVFVHTYIQPLSFTTLVPFPWCF